MFSIFKKKCKYCQNVLPDSFYEDEGMKFCCKNCAKDFKKQKKKLDIKYKRRSCCH